MTRKKKKKIEKRYIGPDMSDDLEGAKIEKKGKKHIRKPKMPARIKKDQTHKKRR
jgi:hypothetical protein